MKYNPEKHHRHSICLKGYDYSQAGLYFVTICLHNRKCLFGEIERNLILQRTKEALARKKNEGVILGSLKGVNLQKQSLQEKKNPIIIR